MSSNTMASRGHARTNYPIRVTVQRKKAAPTTDANNKVDWTDPNNWETLYQPYVRVANQAGRQFFNAKQVQDDLTMILFTPYCSEASTITGGNRIIFKGRTIEVAAALDLTETGSKEVQINCREVK